MKAKIYLTGLALMAVFLVGCQPNQKAPVTTIAVSPFKQIMLVGSKYSDVELGQDKEYKLTLRDCTSEDVNIEQSDSVLLLSASQPAQQKTAKIGVYAPDFTDIKCYFIHQLHTIGTLTADHLSIHMIGIPEAQIAINAKQVGVTYTDEKWCVLEGQCKRADIQFSGIPNSVDGMSKLNAKELIAACMHLDCGILSEIEITVTDSLWLTNGQDCILRIYGSPVIVENELQDCDIHMMNE